MNGIKKLIGLLCIPIALGVCYVLWQQTLAGKIGSTPDEQKVAMYTLLPVSIPIILGLLIFGYYGVTGEYDKIED